MKPISLILTAVVFACVAARPQFPFDSFGGSNPLSSYLASITKSATNAVTVHPAVYNGNNQPPPDSGIVPQKLSQTPASTDSIIGASMAASTGSGSSSGSASGSTPGTGSGSSPGTGSGSSPGTGSGSSPGTESGSTPGTRSGSTPGTGTGSSSGSGSTPGTGSGSSSGSGSGSGSSGSGSDWSPYGPPVFGDDDPFVYKGGITGFVSPLTRLPEPPEIPGL